MDKMSNVEREIAPGEWQARCELAAVFRFAALEGWDDLVLAHMSARVPGTTDEFLFNPREVSFDEMTASRLQKLDGSGKLIGLCPHPPHRFAHPLHIPVYQKFPQAQCIIHLHTRAGSAVSMQKHGLLPSGQYALWLGPIGYLDYAGNLADLGEGQRLADAFGQGRHVIMRSHGTMNWGESISQAFMLAWLMTRACENQVMALTGGKSELYVPTPEVVAETPKTALSITAVDGPFGLINWRAALRRVERLAPDYNT
jgi:ribulose-5-phosphate 4-epimerase/fuculose-1-phosphate aldolase